LLDALDSTTALAPKSFWSAKKSSRRNAVVKSGRKSAMCGSRARSWAGSAATRVYWL
jgi:hypothetical protein